MRREYFWLFSLAASIYELHAYIACNPQWSENNSIQPATANTMLHVLITMRIVVNSLLVVCAIHASALQRSYAILSAEYAKRREEQLREQRRHISSMPSTSSALTASSDGFLDNNPSPSQQVSSQLQKSNADESSATPETRALSAAYGGRTYGTIGENSLVHPVPSTTSTLSQQSKASTEITPLIGPSQHVSDPHSQSVSDMCDLPPISSHITIAENDEDALKSGVKKVRMYHQSDELSHDIMGLRKRLRILLPFLWPSNDRILQIRIFACVLILLAGRLVNILAPLQFKIVVDSLSPKDGSPVKFQWVHVLFYALLRSLQGSVGILSTVQSFVWIPVGQNTTKRISVEMFEHLHKLSLRFHVGRKTGEILRVQDRGVTSVVSLLSSVIFNVLPTLVDIVLACYFFSVMFDLYFGTIVFTTMGSYLAVTIMFTSWRARYRRKSNYLDNEMEARAVDSLLNFETVKYYNAEKFECAEYTHAVDEFQDAEWLSNATMTMMNLGQNLIVQVGMFAGALLSARRVYEGEMTVGDFTMLLTYIMQLYEPLNWFGTYYRVIQKNLIDMEKLLELFDEAIEVKDPVVPAKLEVPRGEVVFDNVSFSYENQPTLKNVSFKVPAGSTVAIVGPSGSGKSTILRLLFRFYDVNSGRILIDGQDIRGVKQTDLRKAIGVVPQDTVLFNDSIRYNIAYGRAGNETGVLMNDVAEAADAAHIHDRIMGFSDQYETRVGERGQRLSGGEKQRVAIARTLLKDPRIVCLDEATSALDTHTERQIQASLHEMTQDRTTLIIAHRLSTIVHADQILIVQSGEIVERGTHAELISNCDSVYYDMWMKQLADAASASYDPILASVGVPFSMPSSAASSHPHHLHSSFSNSVPIQHNTQNSQCCSMNGIETDFVADIGHASICQFEQFGTTQAADPAVPHGRDNGISDEREESIHSQKRHPKNDSMHLAFNQALMPRALNPQGWVPCGPFTAPLPSSIVQQDAFNLEVVSPATSSPSSSSSLAEIDSHNELSMMMNNCSGTAASIPAEDSTNSNMLVSGLGSSPCDTSYGLLHINHRPHTHQKQRRLAKNKQFELNTQQTQP
ncbi:ATP-binding cassette-type vacuolar membrane transporter Hmt1 [Coemansia sp. RSA 1813]|nr:ATP-binding cassette-type vacuolar membrane transporter Hmt1 [Coemansia sp. RSA 1843]KAJ2088650.1 ATP-binding cassette-type vacuolar membrane transporter Hmt1 [Coemansia sp. RSA 986]KAJ2213144.1 ATP-binding cassette-type vacuolar membrane transporter Hmt1 [Coemansia sp. RSA 487]KAJ2568549.1 ATP-binding cassette-type vacuolar membrane transporter Hmt1 [Coemansia sp. RSA 1813]